MNWQLDMVFAPLLPPALIAAGLALALLLIALLARAGLAHTGAGRAGLLLRAAAAAALALALMNPQLRQQQREPLADIAVIIADHSASQQLDNRAARTDAAAAELRRKLAELPGTQVRLRSLPADDGTRGTRLIETLKQTLADIPPERFAGAFLLSDGRVHDMPEKTEQALPPGYAAPVHVLITGRKDERDRWVRITRAGRYGIIGKRLPIRFRVKQHPASGKGAASAAGQSMDISVRVNGKPFTTLRMRPGEEAGISVPVEHAGQNVVEIIAPPMVADAPGGGELTLRNNHVVHTFKGVRDRLRVLLISGIPHPGERIWRDLLKSDPMVDLVHFTILRPPAKQDGTPISELALIAFPTYELFVQKLRKFDLIVFDRYQRRGIMTLEYLRNVVDFVREGGAVLLTVGPEFAEDELTSLYHTPLADILPFAPTGRVIETPYRARLGKQGRRHPLTATLDGAAASAAATPQWGRWFRLIEARLKPDMPHQVLMHGPRDKPLLVLSREGKGRVATLLSDQVWLWARQYDGGGPHVELIRRLAHWLMKEPDLEEEQLTARMRGNTLEITRRTLRDEPPPLSITLPDGKTTRSLAWTRRQPGLFTASLANPAPGLYRLKSGRLQRVFPVGATDVTEFRDLVATQDVLKPLADASGGAVRWIAAGAGDSVRLPDVVKVRPGAAAAGNGWLGIHARDAARVLAVRHYPLFAGLLVLAALLLLLGLAWRLESR